MSLKVLVEGEATVAGLGLVLIGILLGACHNTGLLVVTNTLLEEVGLAGQGDRLHEVEGVSGVEVLRVAEGDQETVGHKLNVLAHELGVHTQKGAGKSIRQELLLNGDGLDDDVLHNLLAGAIVEVREKQAGKVSVETLVTRDKLVGEGETGHQTTLLEPEDGGKGSREEDTLDSSEGNETRSESRLLVLDPADGPFSLLVDAGDYSDRQSPISKNSIKVCGTYWYQWHRRGRCAAWAP